MTNRPSLAHIVLAAPLLAVTLGLAWVTARELAGKTERMLGPLNSAEAAAANNAPAVLQRLRLGDNPTRVYPVRPEIISSLVQHATTLEAAVWSRQISMIRLLEREGAIVDSDMRHHLACLAQDIGATDIAHYLEPKRQCDPQAAMKQVMARTPRDEEDDE
jgi:hypothetical protein